LIWRTEKKVTQELQVGGEVVVRRLRVDDADLFRQVRLAALEDSPDAFGEPLLDASSADWLVRTTRGAVFPDRAVFIAIVGALPVGIV
jgi:hypothetical protein